jgi:hypothetical protein
VWSSKTVNWIYSLSISTFTSGRYINTILHSFIDYKYKCSTSCAYSHFCSEHYHHFFLQKKYFSFNPLLMQGQHKSVNPTYIQLLVYNAPLTTGHLSYLARFQMHWDSKILLNCLPLIRTHFHWFAEGGDLIRGRHHHTMVIAEVIKM